MNNDELPHAGGFPDDKLSKYIRDKRGNLPDDWRAYYFEVRATGIQVRGARAYARPDDVKGWKCIRPYENQATMMMTPQKYGELIG